LGPKPFTDFSGFPQKAVNVARTLENLEKLNLEIADGNHVGASSWIHFVHCIPNLKSLEVHLHI